MGARAKSTVRLPRENLEYLESYAASHGLTVTEVLDRYLTRLRAGNAGDDIHPRVREISGLARSDVDAEALYHQHLLEKHR